MNINYIIDIVDSNLKKKYVDEVPMGGLDPKVVDFIRQSAGVLRAPTNFVFGATLTIVGALLGKKVTIKDGEYRNRCNLFSSIVGVASGAKSPVIDYCLKPVNKMEKSNYDDHLAAYHSAKAKNEDIPTYVKQLIASNETVENLYRVLNNVKDFKSGLLMHQDELLNFFGSNAKKYSDGNIISDFLTLFGGFTPLRVGRVSMELPIYVAEPFISILGGIQKKRLDELFLGQEHNGFFSRWSFWFPNQDSSFIEKSDIAIYQRYANILDIATSTEMENLILQFENLKQLRSIDDELRAIRDKLDDNGEDNLSETIMKEGYIIRRIAAIIHCINAIAEGYRPKETISSDTVEYASQIIEHLFTNSCIADRIIAEKRLAKISGREAIIALNAAYGIKNQSLLSEALGNKPDRSYISKVLAGRK